MASSPSRSLLFIFRPLERLLQILARFLEGAEGIVIGLDGLTIFVNGALALARNVENLPKLDMAPDFGPPRITVTIDGRAVGVRRRLIIPLEEEDLGDAIVSQGTVLVEIEGLVELGERCREVALLLQRLAAKNG